MREPAFHTGRSASVMLIIANVVAFLIECIVWGYRPDFRLNYGEYFALSWAGLSHGYVWQLFTFQFLHVGFLHLLGNCLVIFFFGRELEQVLGVKKFLTLYFGSGIIGGLVQALAGGIATEFFPASLWARQFLGPVVGASAGGMGLIAAFATLYPDRLLTLLVFFVIPVSIRARFLLLFSALVAVFFIIFPVQNFANAAHLGGIAAGIFYIRYAVHWEWHWPRLRRRGNQPPRRLVRVSTGSSAAWGRNRGYSDEEIPAEEFLSKEVDPILDKISAHGIQSLTERERRILQSARDRIKRR